MDCWGCSLFSNYFYTSRKGPQAGIYQARLFIRPERREAPVQNFSVLPYCPIARHFAVEGIYQPVIEKFKPAFEQLFRAATREHSPAAVF